jgi:hypothetical protein
MSANKTQEPAVASCGLRKESGKGVKAKWWLQLGKKQMKVNQKFQHHR